MVLIVQGSGITPALQLVDYSMKTTREVMATNDRKGLLKTPNPPKITLLWHSSLRSKRHDDLERALNLPDLERTYDSFRYLLIGDRGEEPANDGAVLPSMGRSGESRDSIGHNEREYFLRRCRASGIIDKRTVESLMSWISITRCRKSFKDNETDQVFDDTLVNLMKIAEALRSSVPLVDDGKSSNCFRGCDAVSFLVRKGYTPSRESALTLGRELASKLGLFVHASDPHGVLLDDQDQCYVFSKAVVVHRTNAARHLDLTQGLLVALCGHSAFEGEMIQLLKETGLIDEQIFTFPEGNVQLSMLEDFMPAERRSSMSLAPEGSESPKCSTSGLGVFSGQLQDFPTWAKKDSATALVECVVDNVQKLSSVPELDVEGDEECDSDTDDVIEATDSSSAAEEQNGPPIVM